MERSAVYEFWERRVDEMIDESDLWRPSDGAHVGKMRLEMARHPDMHPGAVVGFILKQEPRWDGALLMQAAREAS